MIQSQKTLLCWLIITFIVMFLPTFVIKFAPANYGLVLCMMQFLIVNPIYTIIIGIISGRNIHTRWSLPLISAVIFVFGILFSFGLGEPDFIIYAVIYLIVGIFSMLITTLIVKFTKSK